MLLRPISTFAALSVALTLTSGCAAAQPAPADEQTRGSESRQVIRSEQGAKRVRHKAQAARRIEQETTPLVDVLKVVSETTGKRFLLDVRVPGRVVVGPGDHSSMDYATFLTVLHNNGLAALETGDRVTVMRTAEIRQEPTPLVPEGTSAPEGAWVTRVLAIEHLSAPQLVPILRPLMPTSAHLAAQADSNTLLVVDRFANTERLREVIELMDVPVD